MKNLKQMPLNMLKILKKDGKIDDKKYSWAFSVT